MGTAGPTIRPFNALSGSEIKKIILAEIQRNLDADSRFAGHVCYPLVSWSWKLAMNAYPLDPAQFEVAVADKTTLAPGADMPDVSAPYIEIDISTDRDVSAPSGQTADSARREAGLAVPSPRTVRGPGGARMVVDSPAIDLKAAAATADPEDAPRANVERGGKVFGRSVTQKTAAAPGGAEASPPAGSKPDIERTQEILEQESSKAPE